MPDSTTYDTPADPDYVDGAMPTGVIQKGSPAWKQFELDVKDVMAAHAPDCTVTHNVHREGTISKRDRQIDVLVSGTFAGVPMEIAIECKRNATKKLGIGVVDAFVGKLQDIGVDHGMLWSFGNLDDGAKARASGTFGPKITLRTHDDFLKSIEVEEQFFASPDCPNPNCWGGEITWEDATAENGTAFEYGICTNCGSLAGRCPSCDWVTGLDWSNNRCDGCAAPWRVYRGSDGGVDVDWGEK